MGTEHRARGPLLALLVANAASSLGNNFTTVVVPWFVLQTTGSAAKTGVTLAIGPLPVLLAGLLGGTLVDRFGYRRSSVTADVASGAAVALIPLLALTFGLAFWQLLVLVFLRGLFNSPGEAARQSLIPDLAYHAGMPLERVNSLVQAVGRLTLLFGPPLAGLLIVALGTTNVLWLDALSFAISATLVTVAVPPSLPVRTHSPRQSYRAEVLAGLTTLRRDQLLAWLVATFALGSLLSEPIYVIAFPVFARQVYGNAVDLGLMYSALAAGSLGGLAVYALVGPRLPRHGTLIAGFLVRAAAFWVFVFLPPLPVVLVAIVLSAACFEPINPLAISAVQARVPEGLRGRVFGAIAAISGGTLPLGTLIGGLLLGGVGLVPTLVAIAAVTLMQAVSLPFIPALKAMDAPLVAVPKAVSADP